MRRSAVRFATLTSEDSGFTLSFSRYSYVFVPMEFSYIKFEPKVSSIFFFSKTSREKSRNFLTSFYVFCGGFFHTSLFFKSFARVLLSVCTDDYAVSITLKTIDSNARGTFIQVYSKIFREYESREGTFDRTSSSRFE